MTMTLEGLRADLVTWRPRRTQDLGAIDAAIRERDELRELREIERIARCEMIPDVVIWRKRAERAEAELAKLRKAIDDADRVDPFPSQAGTLIHCSDLLRGKRVALVVIDE